MARLGKSASRVMRMAPAADRGVQGVVAGPAVSSQADAGGMVASAALADQEAPPSMAIPANKGIQPPPSPTPPPAAWEERVEQEILPSFQLAATELPHRTAATANPGRMALMARMAHLGSLPIAEASSVRAMDRTDRMDSMEAAEEAEEAAAARGIYFVSPQILTVREQVVAVGVRVGRAAKAVEAAAAGEGRLESTFIIMVPMVAL
jgi:hypothetical protein